MVSVCDSALAGGTNETEKNPGNLLYPNLTIEGLTSSSTGTLRIVWVALAVHQLTPRSTSFPTFHFCSLCGWHMMRFLCMWSVCEKGSPLGAVAITVLIEDTFCSRLQYFTTQFLNQLSLFFDLQLLYRNVPSDSIFPPLDHVFLIANPTDQASILRWSCHIR